MKPAQRALSLFTSTWDLLLHLVDRRGGAPTSEAIDADLRTGDSPATGDGA
jgi:hypothetical protein